MTLDKNNPNEPIDRRNFNRLAMTALGGVVAGSFVGCNSDAKKTAGETAAKTDPEESADKKTDESEVVVNDWLDDLHVCRGLNACKGKGKDGKNDCAGQGNCATHPEHACGASHDCKFQSGCGTTAGRNECSGKGSCAVPLMEDAWADARIAFEKAMKKAGKEVGAAPESES